MAKFRVRPPEPAEFVVVEAMQYTGGNLSEMISFAAKLATEFSEDFLGSHMTMETDHGTLIVECDDWVIENPAGVIYTCKPDIFESIYQPIKEDS